MSDALLVTPIAVPFLGAGLCLVFWGKEPVHKFIAFAASLVLLGASIAILLRTSEDGIQVTQLGNWPAPLGIVLVADLFSAMMLLMVGILGFAVAMFSLAQIDTRRATWGYYPLFLVLLGGVSGAFLTGDFFNMYVWFEVMLMSSFVLLTVGGGRQQLEGALKYVTLNFLASVLFLATLGLLYSVAGTLNFADLSLRLQDSPNAGLITTIAVLFLVAFGIKAALFPFFFWLPASYHTPPVPISAIFAGLLTKVGAYALIRVFTLIFVEDTSYTHNLILIISGLTMVIGVLGAVAQNEMRRILSVHIISQIGYITMGLGLFTPLGIAGAIFFLVHNMIVKTNLFLVSGLVMRLRGTLDLKLLGGMHSSALVAVIFGVSAMSLAGLPPFSGFFAKLTLIRAGLENGDYLIIGVSIAVSFLTMFSMVKIWNEVFAKAPPEETEGVVTRLSPLELAPAVTLAVLAIAIGVAAGPVLDLSLRAAEQLLDRSEYIRAVLGEGAVQ
jgi:multicomponent Na+:H+ antiporter subunit D